MSQIEKFDLPDIFNLELQLKEKINELVWKSKALEESQQELLQVRQELLNNEVVLEDRKRVINDLEMQLKTANQVIKWIEKEKTKHMNERLQLQINCDTALKERESLLEQAHAAKLENMTLKLNMQKLKETVAANESTKKALENSLLEMQERFSNVHNSLLSNITKLEKEHQLLRKSVESTTQLNKRLQTVGLCTHAIYTKKCEEIKKLQKELVMNRQTDANLPEINFDGVTNYHKRSKFNSKAVLEQIRIDLEKNDETDKEIETMLAEIEND